MWKGCLALGLALALAGCAPSFRSVVYNNSSSDTVLISPLRQVPDPNSADFKTNRFPFVPGTIFQPIEVNKRNSLEGLSAEWALARYCRPKPTLYKFGETGPYPGGLDVIIDYDFDPFVPVFGSGEEQKRRAISDLRLGKNELRYVKRIQIHLTGRQLYSGSSEQLGLAKKAILQTCPHYRKLADVYQVIKIELANVDVAVDYLAGASINLGALEAKILKRISQREHGTNMLYAVTARPLRQ